jgi:hypothetical protein
LGQIQRYLNAAENMGVLPIIYAGLTSGLRQCELLTLSWADFISVIATSVKETPAGSQ